MHWTVRLEGGPRRVSDAAVAYKEKIFSFGGSYSGENHEIRRPIDVFELNTVTYGWTAVPQVEEFLSEAPYQRHGHTVVEYEGKMYVWGGRNYMDAASSVLHQFDPESYCWKVVQTIGQPPPSRHGHSACVINDVMVIFGGFEEEYQRFSQETFLFNFITRRWIELRTFGTAPAWRDFHTATAIGKRMYVFGGSSDPLGQFHSSRDVYFDRLKFLDLNDYTWYEPEVQGDRPCGRSSHSAWSHNGKLYIFGGFSGAIDRHFDELYQFDPQDSIWRKIEPNGRGPTPRRLQCTVRVNDRVFLFGGIKPYTQEMKTTQVPNNGLVQNGLANLYDLFVLDYAPSLKSLASLAALKNKLVDKGACYLPLSIRMELLFMTMPNRISGS